MSKPEPELLEFISSSQDKPITNSRFFLLFLSCFICLGSYFIYDIPAALETSLFEVLSLDMVSFNLLYSIYSLPNILFPIFGGMLIDSLGVRSVLITCSVLILIGQSLVTLGVAHRSYGTVLLGRGLFGCGGENLDMAQSVIVFHWFSGKELSMAFGLNSMTSMMGSVLNDNIEPIVVKHFGLDTGLALGLLICGVSLIATSLAVSLDREREIVNEDNEGNFDWKNVYKFDFIFLLLMVNTVCIDSSIYCFNNIASGFLQERFGYSAVEAGSIMSVSFFVSGFLSPVFGVLADRIGKRGVMLVLADGLVVFFHFFFMFCEDGIDTVRVVFAFVVLGIGFAIYITVFWTILAYVVKKEVVGTAYGVCYAVGNIALVIVPIIVGLIQTNTTKGKGYFWVNTFLCVLSSIGTFSAYLVYKLDLQAGGTLHRAESIDINNKSY